MRLKNIVRCLSLSVILIITTACGGGGDASTKKVVEPIPVPTPIPDPTPVPEPEPTPPVTHVFSGKVIDGYVSGASVWLDLNGDKQHNNDEPITVSGDAGDYTLELSDDEKECLTYATLYVDIPVGAIDEDLGEVTQAYQMSKPPTLLPITDIDLLHISPLTTVLWQQLQDKLSASSKSAMSCEILKNNYSLRTELATEINSVIRNLVSHYNISAQDIYADFIASENAEAYQAAQNIVTGLKTSYAHQLDLETQYPNAIEIRVTVYQNEFYDQGTGFPDAWYRESIIFLPTGYLIETVRLNDDHSAIDLVIYDREETVSPWNDGILSIQKDIYTSNGGQEYICINNESASFTEDGVKYQLSNSSPYSITADFETCNSQGFDNSDRKYYAITYQVSNISYDANFTIYDDLAEFDTLSHWKSLADKTNDLDSTELITHLKQLPYLFDDEVTVEVTDWHKRITDDSKATRVQTDKYSSGLWERLTYSEDYTYIKECSTDGVDWQECN
ncbi:hypothetical protein FGD67_17285 [Colwellia sp. M166]|uniref:hypothetical protein n=1 Tax=Colwellia sp. M166 TaxID=2583805 RepID=UPI00211E6F73|nr:hypothetical protein [Colwellia sp. M166]UUO24774.1 hypothetical protein FGD67_17285 [Colwellia sp. M166]|tara:strand:+ start:89529 stop:91040 length:1512 start_codon:yes stop_codon:yes gene_type:complete